jgi:Linalool dehydratase/isomerase
VARRRFLGINGVAHWPLALGAFSLFIGTLLLWFGTGNVLAPALAWFGSAFAAAITAQGTLAQRIICGGSDFNGRFSVTLVIGISLMLLAVAHVYRLIIGKKQRQQANHYLQTTAPSVAKNFKQRDETTPKELSLADIKRMRFLLDRALQPIENFDGFDWLDQFQTAAVRYQLNFLGYALSIAQATHCPAFGGYLDDAQRNLIIKQTDYRVWRYWRLENLWGNFKLSANPIVRDNIMYTGFCATQIALFHAASGSDDFVPMGSFTPRSAKVKFASNLAGLVSSLINGFKQSRFYLMACEPNWVYPLCNTIGAVAIKAHNSKLWAQHQTPFLQHLEQEFITANGRIIPCKSRYTGLAFPAIGGALPQALPCFFLNAILPHIALRQWLLLRRSLIKNNQLNRLAFWPIDTGNYGLARGAAYAGTAVAAVELGDAEVANLCLNALEKEHPSVEIKGVTHRPKVSVWGHALEFLARCNVANGLQHLVACTHTRQHPIIAQVPYPQVLVAHARYQNNCLTAVFYNGAQAGLQRIVMANLTPHAHYQCQGASTQTIFADANGEASLMLLIDGRTEMNMSKKSEPA